MMAKREQGMAATVGEVRGKERAATFLPGTTLCDNQALSQTTTGHLPAIVQKWASEEE